MHHSNNENCDLNSLGLAYMISLVQMFDVLPFEPLETDEQLKTCPEQCVFL